MKKHEPIPYETEPKKPRKKNKPYLRDIPIGASKTIVWSEIRGAVGDPQVKPGRDETLEHYLHMVALLTLPGLHHGSSFVTVTHHGPHGKPSPKF